MPEVNIEQAFLRWCKSEKVPCVKLKLNPGRGWPDRAVLLPDNRICWIEFKGPVGVLSPQQEFCIRRMKNAGHTVFVCRTVDEARDAIKKISI